MTRSVQIELTLDIEADCVFLKDAGCWVLRDVSHIAVGNQHMTPAITLANFLINTPSINEKIAEAYAQQEP
jgi:hypothetical protein